MTVMGDVDGAVMVPVTCKYVCMVCIFKNKSNHLLKYNQCSNNKTKLLPLINKSLNQPILRVLYFMLYFIATVLLLSLLKKNLRCCYSICLQIK